MKLITVVLYVCTGACGCGLTISIGARHITVTSWSLSKADVISHSVAEATMFLKTFHSVCVDPFNFGWALSMSLMKSLRK